jgi:hypothetical protein
VNEPDANLTDELRRQLSELGDYLVWRIGTN